MAGDKKEAAVPIIVKKKKGGHGGHHGGAWKVAYADFVTAMMALFIVLWIVGQNKSVKEAVSEYFKDPGAFSEKTRSGGILPGSATLPLPDMKIDKKPAAKEPSSEMDHLKREGKRLQGIISTLPLFGDHRDRIEITVSDEGLRIELIENSTGIFFDVGSAKIKSETIQLLKMIAEELGQVQNHVILEGYTDARPFGSGTYSNWELSADRANAARKILEENGLRKDQILEVRGFADRKLRNPGDPMDSSNRRVSIFVVPSKPSPSKDLKPDLAPVPPKEVK